MTETAEHPKPKVGVYALTSCYGCQLMVATVSRLLEIYDATDIQSFTMVSSAGSEHDKVDLAFVEGSVSTEKDKSELMEIRRNAKILVAMGSCALGGGVQSWATGEKDYDTLYREVYGEEKIQFRGLSARPVADFVEVDYHLPGCPPEEEEIIYMLGTFLFGSWPEEKDYPVCHECRLKGNPCILIERGEPCLGPITTAGCRARCINFGVPCIGCRGPVEHDVAWFDSLGAVFLEKGLERGQIRERMKIFGAHNPKLDEMLKKAFLARDNGGDEE